ncbi:hypothetical protein GSI_10230 [Ganoderma sinense ZZ0214-1]|uniref:Uncharacterized protein n=1 Tax=Ganoderma sinense ZZ0214-1 TaxID=1077348 RepID=A0A2G8RZZ4_9APHY|nr:hypothetical protein GSI_10230 [Ganoderma sinense ZZ0214-1]
MWLLNTARAELKFFPTPESVPEGYAILSHVWDKKEQTFQEVQALRIRCAEDGTNPRDFVHDKVREFCILAERGGHEWGWADMCCIDKTSSTELSEAIVSMYRYYSLAEVCYVYLRDVPTASEDDLWRPKSAFRESRWHRRGWTLQELIAPSLVLFLSCTWEILGAKAGLGDLLEEITRVPAAVLRLADEPSDHCVAARMSWAANRETTRPEDEAYCLMGIFGIFMPPLYGEGRNAFLRLQEEILRQIDDPSIFAWGDVYSPVAGLPDKKELLALWNFHALGIRGIGAHGCFAHSPSDFCLGHHMKRRTEHSPYLMESLRERPKQSSISDLSKLPTFNITSYGVEAHLPVFQTRLKEFSGFVALLLGIEFVASDHRPRTLGLFLRETTSPDPTRPLYGTISGRHPSTRLCEFIGRELAAKPEINLEWRTIHILRSSTTTQSIASELQTFTQAWNTPFHISRSHFTTLLQDPGVTFRSLRPKCPTADSFRNQVALDFQLRYPRQEYLIVLRIFLGICTKSTPPSSSPQHWAKIAHGKPEKVFYGDVKHVCAEHHVDLQPRQTYSFTTDTDMEEYSSSLKHTSRLETRDLVTLQIQVELSFKPYAFNPTHVRTIHINFKAVPVKDSIKNGSTPSALLSA